MKKKVLVVLVMVSLLVAVCGTVFATDITATGNQITISNSATTGNSINITTTNTNTANTVTGNTSNTLNVSSTYNTTNTNTNKANTSATNSLPKAGADTTVVFVILALVVSSAYAYKKVSDYNIDIQ